jgi:hypothetical protein
MSKHERPPVTLRPVRQGEKIPVDLGSGFVHRPAPRDGLLIEQGETTIFVPRCEIEDALAKLV